MSDNMESEQPDSNSQGDTEEESSLKTQNPLREDEKNHTNHTDDLKDTHNASEEEEKSNPLISVLKNFPWLSILLGFVIPKIIFGYYSHHNEPFWAAAGSIGWCGGFLGIKYYKTKKVDFFGLLALILLTTKGTVLFIKDNPLIAHLSDGLDNAVFGFLYIGSLLMPKPLIQIFVDAADVKEIPPIIKGTSYYKKAWMIITAVWGLANLLTAAAIVLLKTTGPKTSAFIDSLSGLPMTIFLLIFTVKFSSHYWRSNWDNIQKEAKQKEIH